MSESLWSHWLQHARLSCPSLSPEIFHNSYPLSQWCHPILILCCPLLLLPSIFFQHQSLFQWVSSSHHVVKVLEIQLQHQSFQWIFRVDLLQNWLVWFPCTPRGSQESSLKPQFKSIDSSALSLLYGPNLTSVQDYWKNHSFDIMDLCQQSDVSAF